MVRETGEGSEEWVHRATILLAAAGADTQKWFSSKYFLFRSRNSGERVGRLSLFFFLLSLEKTQKSATFSPATRERVERLLSCTYSPLLTTRLVHYVPLPCAVAALMSPSDALSCFLLVFVYSL